MKSLWLDFVSTASQAWNRSSFTQWLVGVLLTVSAGALLYAFGGPSPQPPSPALAKTNYCLQAAGYDPKHGELLARDVSCTCSTAN